MADSDSPQTAEEYEVEYIVMAKVEGKGKNKQWSYEVKWKNYGPKDNTWEPIGSFAGSEHFVENFWAKVHDDRDWHDISLFKEKEVMLPTGPPPKKKKKAKPKTEPLPQPKAAGSVSEKHRSLAKVGPQVQSKASSSQITGKRKITEVEIEDSEPDQTSSETEVRSIIAEPTSRGKPRRRLDTVESPKRTNSGRKSRASPEVQDEEEETISKQPQRAVRKPKAADASSPLRSRSARAKPSPQVQQRNGKESGQSASRGRPSSSRSRAPTSTRAPSARRPGRPRKQQNVTTRVESESSADEMLLGDDDPVPGGEPTAKPSGAHSDHEADAVGETDIEANAMQLDGPDTGAEADVEDDAMHVDTNATAAIDDLFEIPSSEIFEQQLAVGQDAGHAVRAKSPLAERSAPLRSSVTPKIPAHRARQANPRIMLVDDDLKDAGPSSISTKARIAKSMAHPPAEPSSSKTNGSSKPKRRTSGFKPGPGRSSSGLQLGSTSLLTVVKKGTLQTLRKLNPFGSAEPIDVDASSIPETTDEAPEPEVVPTGGQLLEMAGLNPQTAGELPDFEDADADGEVDPEPHPVNENISKDNNKLADHAPDGDDGKTEAEAGTETHEAQSVENIMMPGSVEDITSKDAERPQLVMSLSGHIVNKPDAAIGSNGNNGDVAAWKQTTIFGPLGVGREGLVSPVLPSPDASTSQPASYGFSVVLTSSLHLPVVLKDVHPPLSATMESLDAIVTKTNVDPPGRFYTGKHADALIKAFRAEGSCARVLKDVTAEENQQQTFDTFSARLKEGGLHLATINGHVLAFCSSDNATLCEHLGMSPNLVGLGNNVLVSEVIIQDDGAYCDAVLDVGEDGSW